MVKTKGKRDEQLHKTERAKLDKKELYRDMSTYEDKFVRRGHFTLLAKLDRITDRIADTEKELDKGKSSWVNIKQADELMDQLINLQDLKSKENMRRANQ